MTTRMAEASGGSAHESLLSTSLIFCNPPRPDVIQDSVVEMRSGRYLSLCAQVGGKTEQELCCPAEVVTLWRLNLDLASMGLLAYGLAVEKDTAQHVRFVLTVSLTG